jgi:hypothetical protein
VGERGSGGDGQVVGKSVILNPIMKNFILFLVSGLPTALCLQGQMSRPKAVEAAPICRVDENLTMVFPNAFTRVDTMGCILIQTKQEKITYQLLKKDGVLNNADKDEWEQGIETAGVAFASQPRFKTFATTVSDTTIGDARGKFIRMKGVEGGMKMSVAIFCTIRQRCAYSIQFTSFRGEEVTLKMMQWFYSHVRFFGKPY